MPSLNHQDRQLFLAAARAGFVQAFIAIQNGDIPAKTIPGKSALNSSAFFGGVVGAAGQHHSEILLKEFEQLELFPWQLKKG